MIYDIESQLGDHKVDAALVEFNAGWVVFRDANMQVIEAMKTEHVDRVSYSKRRE